MALTIRPGTATTSRPKPLPALDPFRSLKPHPLTPAPAPIPSLGPPGPPSIPAAAATQQPFVPPPDPGLDAAIAGYGATRDSTLAGLGADRTRTLLDYGFTEDPSSGALAYDSRNPFSREALRQLHYNQARAGNTTSYAARGQLFSGALQNAANETNRLDQQSRNSLLNALNTSLAGNTQSAAQAQSSYGTQVGLAQSNSLSSTIANQLKSTG